MGKFKKGLFVGGLLGVGLAWLNMTKKGKQTREKLLDQAAEVYGMVKERVMDTDAYQNLTKSKYVAMVNEMVDKYAVKTGLTKEAKKMIKKVVDAQWGMIQKEVAKRKK